EKSRSNQRNEREVKKRAKATLSELGSRRKEVKRLVSTLLKEYGDEVVWTQDNDDKPIEVIATPMLGLNWALVRGGLPKGKVIEFSGKESSGKTTTCYKIMKAVQDAGGVVALIDAENSIDMEYLEKCGVRQGEQ